ncbi:hypothetical protein M2165_002510 [Variovorax sp. TBS-050B]|uniref:hypothetical protein n=1 Tax=Variovorax sp. TBS-050B TaxID=2940551 RepID=UPI002473E12D|nr:hypothetical protein [Variovorax sp. TBS-050B]MDH6592621.1 hypothetical protein [Variovorax sp. TBS-050B]
MDNQQLLHKSCFARAPFHVVPVDNNIVWAGSTTIKTELLRIVKEVRHSQLELSHLALIYGEYGSGKTHALKYLRDHLKREGRSLVAYLDKPKVEKKGSFHGIVKEVIKQIGKNPLRAAVEPIVKYIHDETQRELPEMIKKASPQETQDMGNFVKRAQAECKSNIQETLYPRFPEIFNVFEALVQDDGQAWNYFASKATPAALKAFDLNSGIEDDHDALRALAAIYTVLTTKYPEIPGTPVFDAAYLLVDEMEQFLEMKADEFVSIRTGLRDLFNSCTEHFALFLSATAENASLFHGILEEAIMVRVTANPIHMSSHDEVDDGSRFLTELMKYARNGTQAPSPEHPFTVDGLKEVVERTTAPRTARKLIQNANRAWQGAADVVLKGGQIDVSDMQNIQGLT